MRHWYIFILLALVLVLPIKSVSADTPLQLDTVEVDLWPEYDQPNMLVIYHITIAADATLPAELSLHIPSRVGDPAHVANREADGVLYNTPFTRTVVGDWSVVTFTSTSREIQFEYYDPALIINGSDHSFTYEWQGEYDVHSLSFQVQQPINASNMQITPSFGLGVSGNGGITYYEYVVGQVSTGTKFSISLNYKKADDTLTAAGMPVQPSAPISSQTTGRAPSLNIVIAWTLGGLGIILLVGGGLWYWRAGRTGPDKPRRKRVAALRPGIFFSQKKETSANIVPDGAYCHQCGNRARAGDIFCRVCGTRLRRDET